MKSIKYFSIIVLIVLSINTNAQFTINGSGTTETRMWAHGNYQSNFWAVNYLYAYSFGIDASGIGPFSTEKRTLNVLSYIQTRFFRFLVLLRKNTQHAAKGVYQFVPTQNFDEPWTDEKLYKKYGLTEDEIAFIESMIRPMDVSQNSEADE